jgi:hypothetical protein
MNSAARTPLLSLLVRRELPAAGQAELRAAVAR